MKSLKYLGKSSGKVKDCLVCEHCGNLDKGIGLFDLGGVEYCEFCVKGSGEYTPEQIKSAIKSKKTLNFGKRPANSKKFDYLVILLDSPYHYQNVTFYVSKEDPLFEEFHQFCLEQIKWKDSYTQNSLLRIDYEFKEDVLNICKPTNTNFKCEGGMLAYHNLVTKIVHPKDIYLSVEKQKKYNIKKFNSFNDVLGKDSYWYFDLAQCFEIQKY